MQDDGINPVDMEKQPNRAFVLELTELFSQAVDKKGKQTPPRRHWTIGCEAISGREMFEQTFDMGTKELHNSYTEPLLHKEDSYGYPNFSMSIAAGLKV